MVTNHTKTEENNEDRYILSSGVPRGVLGGEGPPKSCQIQPDCENC